MAARPFIHEDFLLTTDAARRLYHEYAVGMPIVDYHCHLPPRQIAEDHRFRTVTNIWLAGDHYKWRAMRANGIQERLCTGDASDWEKFLAWAATVPRTLRNPLYHWTHMELARPFGITDRLLNEDTARDIYNHCNARLAEPEMSCRGIMRYFNVRLVCTTDDPTDSLEHHKAIAADTAFGIRVLPTFRPDKAMAVEEPAAFNAWIDRLAAAADIHVPDYASFLAALRNRHDYFHQAGCRLSDHGLDTAYGADYTETEIASIFDKIRGGRDLYVGEVIQFKSAMLYEFGLMDAERGWTQQYHFGALRNNNSRMLAHLGPDTGFDSIADLELARPLARLLDRLERHGRLAKTVIYNLWPAHTEVLAAMIGSFQGPQTPGKMQLGTAWWFLDQLDGMRKQMEVLSNFGLLSRFVGMTTDSRSFLSYPRHDYFRRLLCQVLGEDMETGRLPRDFSLLGQLVQDVSYNNAAEYFGFDLHGE